VLRFRGEPVTVVGVARNAKYATLTEITPPFAYFPIDQVWQPTQTLLMRVSADTAEVRRAIEEAVLSVDARAPRPRLSTLERATGIVVLPQRAAAIVTGGLGAIGLLLATVGLYGVMAFSAGRRTREMGIRMALGAARSSLMSMVLREGMKLAGLGIGGGLLLAALVGRLLEKWLFTVSPFDALTFAAMSACFTVTALIAVYLPARRAAAADPLRALRSE